MTLFQSLDFVWWRFFTVLFITLLSFKWLDKKNLKTRLYFFPFMLFIFIYAGIGSSWEKCDVNYIWKYGLYIVTFSICCYFFQRNGKPLNSRLLKARNNKLELFVNKYGKLIIYIYITLILLQLTIDGKITNIVRPPSMDMASAFENSVSGDVNTSPIYYLKNIVYVFYIVSLYKYRHNFKLFTIYLVIPVYLSYVGSAYLGRGTIMLTVLTLIIGYIYCYPKRKKITLISIAIGVPFVIFGLVWYSAYRIGANSEDLDISTALKILSYQETSYPLHYNSINNWGFDLNLFLAYLYWIITLPLPGFLKPTSDIDVYFNFIFTERISGVSRGTDGFSVYLPGLVNEGIMIFGPTFFILHAVILGFFVGKTFKWLRYKPELFLLIYCCVNGAYAVSRGGTGAQYSFYLKNLLIYLIARHFIFNSTINRKI